MSAKDQRLVRWCTLCGQAIGRDGPEDMVLIVCDGSVWWFHDVCALEMEHRVRTMKAGVAMIDGR